MHVHFTVTHEPYPSLVQVYH